MVTIDLAVIRTKFVDYCKDYDDLKTAFNDKALLGAPPSYPVTVTTSASYNDVTTALAAYESDITAADTAINDAKTALIASQALVLANSNPNEWYKLTAATPNDFAPFADTVWIGWQEAAYNTDIIAIDANSLYVVETEPTGAFPTV